MKSISLPFRIDDYGRVAATSDPSKIYADRVRGTALTNFGERVMRPGFGSSVPTTPFESFDDAADEVEAALTTCFQNFLPELSLDSVSILEEDEFSGLVSLEVEYLLPEMLTQQTQTVSININGGTA